MTKSTSGFVKAGLDVFMGTMHFLSSPLILGCYRRIYIHLLSLSKVDVQTSLFCKIAYSVAIFLEMVKSGWHDCHIVGKDKVFQM